MPNSRPLRPSPDSSTTAIRMRPSDERALLAATAGRTTRRIAIAAIAISIAGLAIAAWAALAPAEASCQGAAWDTAPVVDDLPLGWTIGTSQYDAGRKQMTLLGPVPADDTAGQAVVYATITCFPQGAAESVTRSADAATAAGLTVTDRPDLGDQAFESADDSGATFLQLRHGDVVVYLAASGDATAGEVDVLASAFDLSMGGDGGAIAIGTQDVPTPAASDDAGELPSDEAVASESPAAPELEAMLPATVAGVSLTTESFTGADILGDDQGSRAISAALREQGKEPADLRVAQAFDEAGASDLVLSAIAVEGMEQAALRSLVLDSWLAASGAGVVKTDMTVGGRDVTRVDYGDGGAYDYVLAKDDLVYTVTTADADVAAEALAALP